MSFLVEHLSDLIALGIEIAFILLTIRFMGSMKESGARVWQEMAENLLLLSVSLFIGQLLVFSSSFLTNELHMTLILLLGNLFWVGAAAFGFKMVSKLSRRVEKLLSPDF